MAEYLPYIYLLLGFVLLIKGADWMVDSASLLAKRFSVPDFLIGLTVVAFGTSAPELVVSITASLAGANEIVMGNVFGSNVFNIGLILGVAGMMYPLLVQPTTLRYELPFSILLTFIVYLLFNDGLIPNGQGSVSRLDGFFLLGAFVAFLYYVYRSAGLSSDDLDELDAEKAPLLSTGVWLLLGLAGLSFGGNMVVDNAREIAKAFGLSEHIIGLTVVGIGTSLPELVTSINAVLKRKTDIAVGNVIGSNIFNLLLILGTSFVILPIELDEKLAKAVYIDIAVLLAFSIALWLLVGLSGRQPQPDGKKRKAYLLQRWQAVLLFVSMLGYMIFLLSSQH